MAQDRLFQLDYLRARRPRAGARPRSSGADRACAARRPSARTVGLRRIAEAEWERLPAETRALLEAFAQGINALIDESGDRLPIEFDLLDYRPEPWSPVDCLTIEGSFAGT